MEPSIKKILLIFKLIIYTFSICSFSDTFTHHQTGKILYGYPTNITENNQTIIYTVQEGFTSIEFDDWQIQYNHLGRNNAIVVIEITDHLDLNIVTDTVKSAINNSVANGPLFLLLEINSPGGKPQNIEKICDIIIRSNFCPIYAYIKAGKYGGAVGSAAAIALACDKIYMEPETIIGAAYLEMQTQQLSVAWQQYLESLAKLNGKPGSLVRAMVDKDIEVLEVIQNNEKKFIISKQKNPNQTSIRLWSKKGSLLTLTANEAVKSRISDGIELSRERLLKQLGVNNAEIIVDETVRQAVSTFKKVKNKFDRLRSSLDGKIKKVESTESISEAVVLLRQIKDEYKSLLLLAKRFEDLYLDVELIEKQLNTARIYYDKAKGKQRRLDVGTPVVERQNGKDDKKTK